MTITNQGLSVYRFPPLHEDGMRFSMGLGSCGAKCKAATISGHVDEPAVGSDIENGLWRLGLPGALGWPSWELSGLSSCLVLLWDEEKHCQCQLWGKKKCPKPDSSSPHGCLLLPSSSLGLIPPQRGLLVTLSSSHSPKVYLLMLFNFIRRTCHCLEYIASQRAGTTRILFTVAISAPRTHLAHVNTQKLCVEKG